MGALNVAAAALVPGMPHLLAADPAPSWKELAAATRAVGDRLRAAGVEAVLLLSTQWFTVLGHQVQCDPHLSGTRTDENWYAYDYGHLRYDLAVDWFAHERLGAEITFYRGPRESIAVRFETLWDEVT